MISSDPSVTRVHAWAHAASARSTWVMVRVQAGPYAGIGELSDGGAPAALVSAVRQVEALIVELPMGAALTTLRAAVADRRALANEAGAFLWSTVLGGCESAFADLAARMEGVPLSMALGLGSPRPVRCYANINRHFGAQSGQAVADAARRAAIAGYGAVKIAPFSWARLQGASGAELVRQGLRLTRQVAEGLPAGVALMVDCHHLVPPDLADQALRGLATVDPLWVEDLVDVTDPSALRAIRSSAALPLAAGEFVWQPEVARAACVTGALAYWLVDPKHVGGPAGTARLAEAAAGTTLTFHNPSGPVGTAHAAHLAGLATQATWLEVAWGEPDREGYLEPPELIVDGRWVPLDAPGIGVDLVEWQPAGAVPAEWIA